MSVCGCRRVGICAGRLVSMCVHAGGLPRQWLCTHPLAVRALLLLQDSGLPVGVGWLALEEFRLFCFSASLFSARPCTSVLGSSLSVCGMDR